MTCGSKLPEAGDTGIIVGGTIEFAGAHRGRGGGAVRLPLEEGAGKVAWKMGRVGAD